MSGQYCPGRSGHASPFPCSGVCSQNRFSAAECLFGTKDESRLALLDHPCDAGQVGGDGDAAFGDGFEEDVGDAVAVALGRIDSAGQNEEVRAGKAFAKNIVGLEGEKADLSVEARLSNLIRQGAFQRAFADDLTGKGYVAFLQDGAGVDEDIETFFRDIAAGGDEAEGVRVWAGRFLLSGFVRLRVEPVLDEFDAGLWEGGAELVVSFLIADDADRRLLHDLRNGFPAPDIVGVGADTVGDAAVPGCEMGDGGGFGDKVGVEVFDSVLEQEAGQKDGLIETSGGGKEAAVMEADRVDEESEVLSRSSDHFAQMHREIPDHARVYRFMGQIGECFPAIDVGPVVGRRSAAIDAQGGPELADRGDLAQDEVLCPLGESIDEIGDAESWIRGVLHRFP